MANYQICRVYKNWLKYHSILIMMLTRALMLIFSNQFMAASAHMTNHINCPTDKPTYKKLVKWTLCDLLHSLFESATSRI